MLCGACFVLAVLCAVLIFRLCIIKKQLRSIREELPLTTQSSYNRQLTVSLADNSVTALATEMNKNLEHQKQLKFRTEQVERSMKQSVSDIAHDLRTPLTVIKGNLQMLEASEQLSEKGCEYLRVCIDKTDAMKQMADEFFELSVLESDSGAVRLSRIDLTSLLVEFILDSEAVIRCRGIEPDILLPEKSMYVMADESMLQRMLSNLLNNILKHARSSFELSLSLKGDKTVLSFSNELRPDESLDTDRLFERTYRGDKARNGSGAGLGLYIVKLLAEKQNAAVQANIRDNKLDISIVFDTAE
ncbi:MAG: HAMP domain-containing histidine kinase [Oscillospiraceae bacterium]|nr:HAMP domain-containing histidine kinase [Oscillospiraceae bacterium]